MKPLLRASTISIAACAASLAAASLAAAQDGQFRAGLPLGVNQGDQRVPMSDNVKVYGALVNTESCSYDPGRDLIVAVNRGANQNQVPNDGTIALINHDGSVHTSRWIGETRDGLVLNHPFGSDIVGGKLYVADRDGGTSDTDPSISVIRIFDMETGAPAGEIATPESSGFNDIEVTEDGTIWATQTGAAGENPDMSTWRVFKVSPDGTAEVVIEGEILARPNGIAFDGDGNIVVVTVGSDAVLTFSPEGELLKTEQAAQRGNDGLVIMPDGTKYVSSVQNGGISKISPDGTVELIATGIPSAASMCYDEGANQLVIPMNPNNALAFVPLGG